MSRIGSKGISGFTLVEVLTAIVILSVGMIGIIHAYITLMNGVTASAFTVEASYLLKNKMSDVEREAIEGIGLPARKSSGAFGESASGFRWEEEVGGVNARSAAPQSPSANNKAALEEGLCLARVSIISSLGYSGKLSAYTYFEDYSD